jgi:hypothetical protein
MARLRTFFFLLILLPVVAAARSEPIDLFPDEIARAVRDLRITGGTMTIVLLKDLPESDYSPVIQKVKYHFLNDSVYVQSFRDRLISRRHYYVLRGDQALPFDRKKGHGITNETVTTKDSAGYEVEVRIQRNGKDSVVFYSRGYADSLRDCYVTLRRNSLQPEMEQESVKYSWDRTVTSDYLCRNGSRRMTKQVVYLREEDVRLLVETFITTFDGDTTASTEREIATHYQYDNRGRLIHVIKIEYLGEPTYSIIRPMRISYEDP